MSDLVERLKSYLPCEVCGGTGGFNCPGCYGGGLAVPMILRNPNGPEAATRIETLELERDAARNAALEEAAKVADALLIAEDGYEPGSAFDAGRWSSANQIAEAIRALGGTL